LFIVFRHFTGVAASPVRAGNNCIIFVHITCITAVGTIGCDFIIFAA
jgi:hypothetical protein